MLCAVRPVFVRAEANYERSAGRKGDDKAPAHASVVGDGWEMIRDDKGWWVGWWVPVGLSMLQQT